MRDPTARIRTFARWVRALLAVNGLARLLLVVVGLSVLSLGLDLWLRFDLGARIWLSHMMVASWAFVLWKRVVAPQLGRWDILDVAQATDHALGNPGWLTRRFASAQQFAVAATGARTGDSEELAALARSRASEELEEFRLRDKLDWIGATRSAALLVAMIAIPTSAAIFRPDDTSLWFSRWFQGSDARWPQDTWLEIDGLRDGQLVVPRGEPWEIRVRARDGSTIPDDVRATFRIDGGSKVKSDLVKYGDNDFRLTLPPVQDGGDIRFVGNDDKQGPFRIIPRARPRIREFRVTATLPGRDPVSLSFQSQDKDIGFKTKTSVQLEIAATEPIRTCDVIADDATAPHPVPIDAATWRMSWVHESSRSFAIEVVSEETGLRSHPHALDLALENDRPPKVTLRITGVRNRVTPIARIPSRVLAEDDGGIVSADLSVTVRPAPTASGSPRSQRDVLYGPDDQAEERQVERDQEARLADLGAAPGETVEITGTAMDRCHLGPQIGRSSTRVLRVVRPEVLYREISLRLQRNRARFRKGVSEAQALADLLRDEPGADQWSGLMRRHRLVERTTWAVRRTLSESLLELTLNGLVEEQATIIVTSTVLDPLDNLYDRMLQEQRSDLDKRLEGQNEPPTGDLEGRQKGIVVQMERILNAMKQWDSFIDLVNQLDEVIDIQTGVRKETQDVAPDKSDGKPDGGKKNDKKAGKENGK